MKQLVSGLLLFYTSLVWAQSYVPEQNDPRIKIKPAIAIKAWPFDLKDVKLLNGPFHHAMKMDSAYLLVLNPNRLLYRFYQNAGLPVKDSVYGGWESEGLSGHSMGHYLSACSMMYISTGNGEFKRRVNYIVDELEKCQTARNTGYVGAIPKEDSLFGKVALGEIKASGFNLNGGWSPWYTVHKLMAGLIDAYLYAGNKKALKIVSAMADWTYNTVNHLPDSLRLKMLNCEYGGMNNVLADIYAITGNKKYLDLSYKFYDEFVMGKLAQRIDPMPGKHSNTNIPKAIGSARQYELTGNERDKTIASFFWKTITDHHSYVIGGNSNYEYCGKPDSLNDRLSDNTCETCNTYNMLKLTRHIFSWQPSSTLMDYYERALYNHILASQNPENGMMTYFVPLRMGTKKEFSDSFNTFTCCVGTGMENHSKYVEQIYSHDEEGLFVNLFIPSILNWKQKNVMITQQTKFPEEGKIKLIVAAKKPAVFILRIRKPFWSNGLPDIYVNGRSVPAEIDQYGFLFVRRQWMNRDVITVNFSLELYSEAMPDNPNRIAIKYGPLVLAGQLGKTMPDAVYGTPVLLTSDKNVQNWLKPVGTQALAFRMQKTGQPFDVTLIPFYKVYDQYYSVYWDYLTPGAWETRKEEYEKEKKRQREIEERTIDNFSVGEMQSEKDHNLISSQQSYVSDALGRKGREARSGNYFSFDMKVVHGIKNILLLTYIGDDKDRMFDILVDGKKLTKVEWQGGTTGKFYDEIYPIPNEVLNNKSKITVRIEANYGKTAGRIFSARIIKTE